ncbi:MAG: hypothetical protein M3Q58_08420 [Bacteroidota bacterium]|nr:hypothetical protein [Bacteroidota bacterium]
MMKLKLLMIFFFLTLTAKADYTPLKLYQMIITAEKIVYGEITSLDTKTFTLRIENSLTGEKGSLTIYRFKDWACASRWTEYKIGQKVLLFLYLNKNNGQLMTMSAGNEGELPIYKDSIYINGRALDILPPLEKNKSELSKKEEYFESNHYTIYGKKFYGYRIDIKEFIQSVLTIKRCFKSGMRKDLDSVKPQLHCPEEIVEKQNAEDKLFRWTYQKLIK